MKKVTDRDLGGYVLDSTRRMTVKKELAIDILEKCSELIRVRIKDLENRISELKEVLELIDTGKEMYLLAGGGYTYVDKDGERYQYNVINGKPILTSRNFKIYEIVEYCDMSDIGQNTGNGRSIVYAYVDKVVKTRLIK